MITKTTKNPTQAQASNRILMGTEIKGEIKSDGDLRVDGKVDGTVTIKGKLVVGEKGVVEGDIDCANVTVSGLLKGKINVSELTALSSTARIDGDLVTTKLSVEPGAEFNGTCSMGAVVRNIKEEPKQAKSAS